MPAIENKFGLNFSRGTKKTVSSITSSAIKVSAMQWFFFESFTVIGPVPRKSVQVSQGPKEETEGNTCRNVENAQGNKRNTTSNMRKHKSKWRETYGK